MILELLKEERILPGLTVKDYHKALQTMLARSSAVDKTRLMENIRKREKLMITSPGKGIALPRVSAEALPAAEVIIGTNAAGMNHAGLDGLPIQIIFLHVFPPSDSGAAVLAQSLRILNDDNLRYELLRAATAAEIIDLIRRWEET